MGIIATGDQFIEDIDNQKNLKVTGMEAMAVEMEGAAVAQVCAEYHIPYILICTISDKANESAHVSLQDFSVKGAGYYQALCLKPIKFELQQPILSHKHSFCVTYTVRCFIF